MIMIQPAPPIIRRPPQPADLYPFVVLHLERCALSPQLLRDGLQIESQVVTQEVAHFGVLVVAIQGLGELRVRGVDVDVGTYRDLLSGTSWRVVEGVRAYLSGRA